MSCTTIHGMSASGTSTAKANGQSDNKAQRPTTTGRASRATQPWPLYKLLLPGEPCFIDIEFQKYHVEGAPKQSHRIGRIAALNSKGDVALDVYAIYPREEGVKKCYQPARFGVTTKDLLFKNGGVAARKVERWVANLVKDRTVVIHGGKHDLTSFYFKKDVWANSTIHDTQHIYSHMQHDGTPGLGTLAYKLLGRQIQVDQHSPYEDVEAMREMYLMKYPYDRDAELATLRAQYGKTQSPVAVGQKDSTGTDHLKSLQHKDKKQFGQGNVSGSAKRRNRKKAAAANQAKGN